jgi:ketosteroid isomerase-like protein
MALSKKDVVAQVNAAFARNDVETFLTHCHEDFIFGMVGHERVVGKDAIRKFMASGPGEPPRFDVKVVVAEGDFVTCIGDMTMKENGSVVPYAYCDVWRFSGDKLAELQAFVIKTSAVTT